MEDWSNTNVRRLSDSYKLKINGRMTITDFDRTVNGWSPNLVGRARKTIVELHISIGVVFVKSLSYGKGRLRFLFDGLV